jgi:formylglycine-generating enzyme required for sulfatase activity/Mrp family chromosome partitioning ATPase
MIICFYSYKGGVGRSTALANVAELLFREGRDVLMVDWDLEAPGLEFFFRDGRSELREPTEKPGVMDLLLAYCEKIRQPVALGEDPLPFIDPEPFVQEVYPGTPGAGRLRLLTAGRRQAGELDEYARKVRSFDWQHFWEDLEGKRYLEWLRNRLNAMAPVVLLDSRTGLTEMGGICTYHFGDAVVAFCGPSEQCVQGTARMARSFTDPGTARLRGDRSLAVLVVPSRVDESEGGAFEDFKVAFAGAFGRDAFPAARPLAGTVEQLWGLRIPYVSGYAFRERVVAREPAKRRHDSLYAAFDGLTTCILQTIAAETGVGPYAPRAPCAAGDDPGPLRTAYLNYVAASAGQLSLLGIDPKTAADPAAQINLGAVYTALMTLHPEESTEDMARSRLGPQRRDTERRMSALAQLNERPRLVLLGDPGSGKSTFVNFVALCLAGEGLGRTDANLELLTEPLPADDAETSAGKRKPRTQPWQHGALLPVRVVLRDFAARGLPDEVRPPGTAEHLTAFIDGELTAAGLGEYVPHLKRVLLSQGGLLLLDGLDEVPDAARRHDQIKQAVEDFAETFGKVRILVTSRTYAYQRQEWRLRGFGEAVLAPFTPAQTNRFIDRWYQHAADLRHLNRADSQGRAELLKRAIAGSERLAALAARPLLLTLMASLHAWRGGNLPEKRVDLYADTVELLLDWWESPKVVRDKDGKPVVYQRSLGEWLKADRAQVRGVLNELAFVVHAAQPEKADHAADIAEGDLLAALLRLSRDPAAKDDPARVEGLANYLSVRAGLLLPRGEGVYTFPHRMFQEYLAACHLTDRETPEMIADLARNAPGRWREVTLLVAAKYARGGAASLWSLAENLCPGEVDATQTPADAWGALLAGQALVDSADLAAVSRVNRPKLDRIRMHLLQVLDAGALPAVERIEAGRVLARLGDPRFCADRLGLPADDLWGFVPVPAGPCAMGAGNAAHTVTLPEFHLSRYPVTNAQFACFVEAGGYGQPAYWPEAVAAGVWNAGQVAGWGDAEARIAPRRFSDPFGLPNHPVVGITWYEALAYCRWLDAELRTSQLTPAPLRELLDNGYRVMLPSEAEWEKAARGSAACRVYPWGDDPDSDRANCRETGIGATSAAGCFPKGASPYGCLDLIGNVWEWTRSAFAPYPYDPADGRESAEAGRDTQYILRGGAFYCRFEDVLPSTRYRSYPNFSDCDSGFRLALIPFRDAGS